MDTRALDLTFDGRRTATVRPTAPGPWPGVVMLHEIFGLDDVLRRQAERLAAAGYVVYAPDLLGDGVRIGCVARALRALTSRTGRSWEVIEAARQALLADADCSGRVGVIGFCMGGGYALVLASPDADVPAAGGFSVSAVNYGMIPADIDDLTRRACPVVASYGGRDRTTDRIVELETALATASVPRDVKVYAPAGHSFLNDAPNGPLLMRAIAKIAHVGPEPASAADAWLRIEAFFATHLGRAQDPGPA